MAKIIQTVQTPGVYLNETSAFPGDVPPISTAVPAFVGYTEKAVQGGNDVTNMPVRIGSLTEYQSVFGGAPPSIQVKKGAPLPIVPGQFFLYHSLQLYFANGGTACYIVSIGDYSHDPVMGDFFSKPAAGATRSNKPVGIDALVREAEPTLLLAPDAVLLDADDCFQVQRYMLTHCAALQNRFAILDIHNGFQGRTLDENDVIKVFRDNMTDPGTFRWGAAYYPWLLSSFLLKEPSSLLPPSAAIAGIYCATDQNRGVFHAPANVSIVQATGLAVPINDHQQEDLNTPFDGKAVNAIRNFAGQGILVWGARTLDGNSQDWRYISVRRTVIYIEQSIKNLLELYVFSANTQATWTAVKAMAENFLTGLWRDGGLAGATAQDAFFVQVGLGSTMTNEDILNGFMNMTIGVAISRPAEFIVLTFQQQMQAS